jgi:hypothetical protein
VTPGIEIGQLSAISTHARGFAAPRPGPADCFGDVARRG